MMRFWKNYVAAFILNIALALLVLFLRGFGLRIYYVDAFSVAGFVSILFGLLVWVAAAGAFDTIGYGFSTLSAHRKYKDLYEYSLQKKEKRRRSNKAFMPFVVTGIVFLIISLLISLG